MKKSIFIVAIMAALSTPVLAGGNSNNNGPIFGGDTTNNYNTTNQGGRGGNAYSGAAAGAVAGASAGANASNFNTNHIGVGVRNHNANVGINSQDQTVRNSNYMEGQRQSSSNTNLIGGSSQSLSNQNDLGNSNYMEGQSQQQSQGNKQVMEYNESEGIHYSGEYTVKSAPGVALGGIDPTAPCAISLEGAGSGIGFSLALGTAYVDKNCELREDVRLGLSGDETSRSLANQVIQKRLRSHLEEEKDEKDSAVASGRGSTTTEGIFALTNY